MEIKSNELNNWLYLNYKQKPRHLLDSGYDATVKWFHGLQWEMKWGIYIKFFEFYCISISDTFLLHAWDDFRGYDGYSYNIQHLVDSEYAKSGKKKQNTSPSPPNWIKTRDEAQKKCVEHAFEILENQD